MWYTEIDPKGLRATLFVAASLLMAACSGSTAPSAQPTPSTAVITSDTVVESARPTPSPTPVDPVDRVPAPEDIDVAYMQQVADRFAQREGDVLRKLGEDREYTPELDAMIAEYAGGKYRKLTQAGYRDVAASASFDERYESQPGDPVWTVQSVDAAEFPCVSAFGHADLSATRLGGPFPGRPTLFAFEVRDQASDFSPWELVRVAIPASDDAEISDIDLCAA